MMKNLIRGGAIMSLLSMFVVFIYAQAQTVSTSTIGSESRSVTEDNIDNNLGNTQTTQSNTNKKDKKKLVKTTASIKPTTATGNSRGSFSASAYCFSGRTAMGHAVRRGLIAADPRVLKLGSTVYVEAGPWSGNYLVSDTGGAIKGKKIDIWVPSCSEARRFGRRSVQVFSAQ